MPSFSFFSSGKKSDKDKSDNDSSRSHSAGSSRQDAQGSAPGDLAASLQQSMGNQALARRGQSQGSSGSGNAPPQQTEEQIRQTALNNERDLTAPLLAAEYYNTVLKNASLQTHHYLTKDKETAALRKNLQDAAVAAIHNDIDTNSPASAGQKKDAKAYAAELVESKGVVSASLEKYADVSVQKNLDASKQTLLETKAKDGFGTVAPKTGIPLAKQIKEASQKAEKSVGAAASTMLDTSVKEAKLAILGEIQNNMQALHTHIDVGKLGTDEAALRQQLDNRLVEDTVIDNVYKDALSAPIRKAVLLKLGVGRRAFRRSAELNQFRQQLKDAAREQARENIDNQLDNNNLTKDKGDVGKKYYGMMAKTEAYATSKTSVDHIMEQYADDILNRVLPAAAIKAELKEAAQTSAYGVARANQNDKKRIDKAALSAAQKKAASLYDIKMPAAEKEARLLTKGDKDTGDKPDAVERATMIDSVKAQVTSDDIAGKAIKYVIEEDSLNKGFSKIASIIDFAVPSPGDSASLEFELKIPIHAGVYFLIALGAEAEKEENELSLSSEITIGAGFGAFGLDANARVGYYMACQGTSALSAVNLMSYGMYRQMRMFSADAADSLWGQGGKSGMSKLEEAELWAAMVEQKELNNDDNFVDVGLTSKLQGEVNAGIFEAGLGIGHKRLNRYNKDSVGANAYGLGDATDLANLNKKADALLKGGRRRTLDVESSLSLEIMGTSVDFSIEAELVWMNGKFSEVEVSIGAALPFQYGEETSEWAQTLAKLVAPVSGLLKNTVGHVQNTKKDKKPSEYIGGVADMASDTLFVVPQFDEWGESFASQLQDQDEVNQTVRSWFTSKAVDEDELSNKIALSSSLDFSLNISAEYDDQGNTSKWEVSLEIAQTKGLEVDAGVASVSVEKSKRLGKLALGRENGQLGVKGGLFGIEKT